MFNESIIAGLSDGGIINDSASLAIIISSAVSGLWLASIVMRFIWAFVDDSDMLWIEKDSAGLEFGLVFLIFPLGGLFLLTPIIILLHYPYLWISISILLFLMFVARHTRRTNKIINEHIKDKRSHRSTKSCKNEN